MQNTNTQIPNYLKQIKLPDKASHKGQNGKLLIIGGSELFHAASKWSLDVASKFVDMVFYASVPSNNELIQAAKHEFWNGIVIPREEIENYIDEADCILIGPGMTRSEFSGATFTELTDEEWNENTEKVVNYLLKKYPQKKWVLDAGALQMVNPSLLTETCIVTPHLGELQRLLTHAEKGRDTTENFSSEGDLNQVLASSHMLQLREKGITFLVKGEADTVIHQDTQIAVPGGNAGMTKGGTGDVLAGLVAALYCTHDALTAAVVASYINKKTGEYLYEHAGPYYNASDLVVNLPKIMWQQLTNNKN